MTDAPDPIAQQDDWNALEAALRYTLVDRGGGGVWANCGPMWNDEFVVTPILAHFKPVILAALREARQEISALRNASENVVMALYGKMLGWPQTVDGMVQLIVAPAKDIDKLVAERDALKAMLARWDAWWYSGTNNPEPHPADGLAAQSRALLSGESHP